MDRQVLRIGLVGVGWMGMTHLNSYAQVEGVQLVGVADANREGAQRLAQQAGIEAFGSVEEMLSRTELDAVDICTPPSSHLEIALACIERGLHVLCEKPLAHCPEAAERMVEAAQRRGVLLMTAFCHRFHPPVLHLKRLIDEGELGEVVMFRNRFAGILPRVEERWFSQRDIAGGGVVMDTCVHSIDLFRYLVGEVAEVKAVLRQTNSAIREVEDTAALLLSTEDGRIGVIEASWVLEAGVNVVEVYGTQGVAWVHYWDGFTSQYRTQKTGEWRPLDESAPDRFVRELQHFVDACLGKAPLRVSGEDGLRAVQIVYEAYAQSPLYASGGG